MKILYSCLSLSWGGLEMFTITAVKQLLKRGYEVDLLCYPKSRLHKEAEAYCINVQVAKAKSYFHPLTILKLKKLIKREEYDIIHSQYSKDLFTIVPALKLLKSGIPLLLTKQVGSYIVKKDFLHRMVYNRVTLALAISEVIRKNLADTTPLNDEKIALMHNGVDVNKFNPDRVDCKKVRFEYKVKDVEILIGMLARFSPGKGHEEFLTAASNLNKRFNYLKFMIVGEASRGEETYAEGIRNMAKQLGLENVIFTGFRADTPEILASLEIFVFPSHSEAFGIALIEAMAMEKPSVCSNSDGILDIAVDGVTSLLFEKGNAASLEAKLEILIKDQRMRETLGKNGRQRVIENFDIELVTKKVIDIYKNLILAMTSQSQDKTVK